MKFKSEQTNLKLNKILDVIARSNEALNKNFTYDDADVYGISQVFNIPESDAKKVYDNFYTTIKGEK
jgi:hypothetical protein|tara:strand:+ start:673 stop:873 length:201 start_codon:yes stop_codon:yes gene_type:complete